MASLVSTFLALLMFCTTYVESNLDGWKMTDRFNGFRFEIMDSHVPDGMKEKIQGEFQRTNWFAMIEVKNMQQSLPNI